MLKIRNAVFLLLLGAAVQAQAGSASAATAGSAPVQKIPQNNEIDPNELVSPLKNVKVPTIVDHPLFSVTIPNGWSGIQGGTPKRYESYTITASSDFMNDPTYFHIMRRYGKAGTTQEHFERFKKDPKYKDVAMRTIKGQSWVQGFQDSDLDTGPKSKIWVLTTTKNSMNWVIYAAIPVADLTKYQGAMESIIDSVHLKSANNPAVPKK